MPLNPQQIAFKEGYTNPSSETFGNAYASAKNAGFAQEYAEVITAPSREIAWIAEIIRDQNRLSKAEKVIDKTLDLDASDDTNKLRVQTDVAKFVASRLGKHKYSERQELTGANGKELAPVSKLDDDQLDRLISTVERAVGGASTREAEEDQGESA